MYSSPQYGARAINAGATSAGLPDKRFNGDGGVDETEGEGDTQGTTQVAPVSRSIRTISVLLTPKADEDLVIYG